MAISFTPQQQKAIDLHQRNILVSAAAGSGKTAVLVERILRMICDEEHPVDIDRLLIVTFTNAAAAEMRERISAGILKQLALHPESEHIQRQAALLHNALITTIDSFCMFLLKNHFNEIGVDPAFRVMDEGEKKLLVADVLAELLEDHYALDKDSEEYRRFTECVEYFCPGGREGVLEGYILDLYRFSESMPWPEEWLKERLGDYGQSSLEELENTSYAKYLKNHLYKMLEGCLEIYRRLQSLCQEPDGPYMYGALVDQELEQLERLAELTSLEEYAARLPALSFGRLPSKKDDSVSPLKRELAKNLRAKMKDVLSGLGQKFFTTPLELALAQGAKCAEPLETLLYLVLEFRERLKERKQADKKVDFGDLEHYALEILLKRNGGEAGFTASGPETAAPEVAALGGVAASTESEAAVPGGVAASTESEAAVPEGVAVATESEAAVLGGVAASSGAGFTASQVALEYRQHFAEILIDEYQDSNLVQEYLLWAVSGEEDGHCNRFMVGDVKQSIYKFRLARPELFLEKYETYSAEESDCQRIDLSRNFRSRREVVDTVNGIFGRIMSRDVGGIEYDDRAALYLGAEYPANEGCESELLLVEKPGKEEGLLSGMEAASGGGTRFGAAAGEGGRFGAASGEGGLFEAAAGETLTSKQAEALAIAGRIKELLADFQVTDKETGELRPVRFRDMVILLRTNSGWDEEFKSVLEEEGIPVYITSKTGYFAAPEVQNLLQLLRVLDNPRQDIPLFGVMKSVFGGFTEEEIALLRSRDRESCLIEVLKRTAGEAVPMAEEEAIQAAEKPSSDLPAGLVEKVRSFLEMLRHYRELTVYLPIRELLGQIVEDTGYLSYVSALPAGSKRRANVEMLFTKASDFAKTSYHGLFHFVRYMEQLEKYDVDYGEAETLDENADVVRIMSIHKSKGLEFPVTFVSGLSKRFNMQDTNQALIVDMDMGLGTDYVDAGRRLRNKTLRRLVLARKMKEDNLSEELRVLYVALTRPKEKLIMTAVLENAAEKWEEQKALQTDHLTYPEFMEAGSFLDFLLPVAEKAGVGVRILEPQNLEGGRRREQVRLLEKRVWLEGASALADPGDLEALWQRFAWKYPLEALRKLYTKTTVSELKLAAMAEKDEEAYHAFEEKEVVPYLPKFARQQEEPGPTLRGNAYHRVMELLDYEAVYRGIFPEGDTVSPGDFQEMFPETLPEGKSAGKRARAILYQNLEDWLEGQQSSGRLSQEFARALNLYQLAGFLRRPIAFQMWQAVRRGGLHREQPFVYGVSASRLGKNFPADETVLIQGIIDAYFEENGEITVLDYKTDAVSDGEELLKRYETQLAYYGEALSQLTGLPVTRKILYSFYLGKEILC